VQIGKHIKIGFSTNVRHRLKSLATSNCHDIRLLATIPGGRELEQRFHQCFHAHRIRGEFFRYEGRLFSFLEFVGQGKLPVAWQHLEDTSPERIERRYEEQRQRRIAERRKTKAEEDAYYARLVTERKQRLGW
jgi:hypothetical protein